MFKNNPDKIPQIFGIIMVVMILLVIISGMYHGVENIVPVKAQTVESTSK